MNENIDLTQILKDCPKGTKFYSSLHGNLLFSYIYLSSSASKITFIKPDSTSMADGTPITVDYYRDGRYYPNQGECTIFPSIDQRDWSKFTAPWYKPEKKETETETKKFDPKTLKAFNKVLVRDGVGYKWNVSFYSYKVVGRGHRCVDNIYDYCIPYNDTTKHLLGTASEAPDFYRYWEN